MKRFVREFIGFVLYIYTVLFCRKPLILSLYFHDPSTKVFENVIKWCVSHKYRFVDISEIYNILINKVQPSNRIAFISFDDGWETNLALLPIVEKYQVPITIFVATGPVASGNFWWEYAQKVYGHKGVERMKKLPYNQFKEEMTVLLNSQRMERSAINEMELHKLMRHPLVSIQSHTVTHPILTNCDDITLEWELAESRKYIEKFSSNNKKEVIAISYPNGNFGVREVTAVKNAGYKIAFTTEPKQVDVKNIDIYLVPRIAINTYGGKYENISKIYRIWQKIVK